MGACRRRDKVPVLERRVPDLPPRYGHDPTVRIDRQIRALSPFPGAWCQVGQERVKILLSEVAEGRGEPGSVLSDDLTVACGEGAIRLIRLQRAGKAAMEAAEFVRGMALPAGAVIT